MNLSNHSNTTAVTTEEIRRCIEKKKWTSVRRKLQNSNAEEAIMDNEGNQMLLAACKYGAPADIILTLVSVKPELLQERDDKCGHTPLHVACLNVTTKKNTPDVLSALVKQHPSAALCRDSCGNTPLHLICNNPCRSPLALIAIDILSSRVPAALMIENEDGHTPLELFLLSQDHEAYFDGESLQECALTIMHTFSSKYLRNAQRKKRKEASTSTYSQEHDLTGQEKVVLIAAS